MSECISGTWRVWTDNYRRAMRYAREIEGGLVPVELGAGLEAGRCWISNQQQMSWIFLILTSKPFRNQVRHS